MILKSDTQRDYSNDSQDNDDDEDMMMPNNLFFKNGTLFLPKFQYFLQ